VGIKLKLTFSNFFQFFVWGAWLTTIANYWFGTQKWEEAQFGAVFSTMGIASIFVPTITGIIADRWLNAEKLFGILHILYGLTLLYITQVGDPSTFFWIMLLAMCFYMPTIALNNSISYTILKNNNYDVVKDFPPIRVWGTVGFIAAMWLTNLSGSKASEMQFYIAGGFAILLGIYSFTLPACPPQKQIDKNTSFLKLLGLDAFKLFANKQIAIFFIFSLFLGAALQLTNAYGDLYLDEFKFYPKYADSLVIKYSTLIISISQVSETLFILAIPYFLRKFGIKIVMLISMAAWVLRFGLFSIGNPQEGFILIILSCIVYGMAFDFFNISGSIFTEKSVPPAMRSSAQGLFMMMTNGFGAVFGSISAGWIIEKFFLFKFNTTQELAQHLQTDVNNEKFQALITNQGYPINDAGEFLKTVTLKDWSSIWLSFAVYAFVIGILFMILFKYRHNPEKEIQVKH